MKTNVTKKNDPPPKKKGEIRFRNRRILKRVFIVTIAIDTVLGGLLIYMLFLHAPYFNLQYVEVTGNRRLSRAEIVEASEVHSGQNLLTIDLSEIAVRLKRHPWIRSSSIYRRLPGQIIIEVDERVPRAILAAGKIYYVDDQGELFTRVLPGDSMDYPLFTGVTAEDIKQNASEIQDLVRTGFMLIDNLERTAIELDIGGIAEIRLNLDEGLTIQSKSGRLIVFGKDDLEVKLFRYEKLKRYLTERGEWNNARIINLDFEDRALVRSDKSRLQG
jgi:cell division protein FtsQ